MAQNSCASAAQKAWLLTEPGFIVMEYEVQEVRYSLCNSLLYTRKWSGWNPFMTGSTIPEDIQLKTARCVLRKFAMADIPFVFSASRYPGFCDGMRWSPPASLEDLIPPCEANQKSWESGTGFTFTIIECAGANPVGRIAIRHETDDVWNIGFWTHPDFQSRGFMTEAAIRVVGWGFDTLTADRILASHATWNKASRRVLEKIGMQFVRTEAKGFEKNGEWIAEDLLQIRRSEWSAPSVT